MRRTKIVCTIGPATETEEARRALIAGGMNLARLNFSHGNQTWHGQMIRRLRRISREMGAVVGIIQDLCGPKIRVGNIPNPPRVLKRGKMVVLGAAGEEMIPLTWPAAVSLLRRGDHVLLDDGAMELRVERTHREDAECVVLRGGELRPGKGVNIPASRLAGALTEKDKADLAFGLKAGVDWVALSFVRSAQDIALLREEMKRAGGEAPIIAKIEKPEAVAHLDSIIAAADGVMVARGDLGVEMPLEQVPLLQKEIIEKCAYAGKPVIVATQMLESMLHASRPTRAEVSDIANAILDGADALMLSGETAVGEYPQAALKVMDKVAREMEKSLDYPRLLEERSAFPCFTTTDAISQACGLVAEDLKAAAIITSTASGHTAAMVSRLRPEMPVLAITPNEKILRRLALWWGVRPALVKRAKNTDETIRIAIAAAKEEGIARAGQRIVITAGVPPGVPGHTNLIKVETVR